MLKQIELFSFESHKHSVIDLTEGINIFSGSSGQGKSSIRRAIAWVLTNKPNGSKMISWWAFNSKGIQTEPCRVILTFDDLIIERQKGPNLNGYLINGGKPLEAVGTSLPDEVASLLNISEINLEAQLDAPFLLSESAGEVARYLNRIVNLEEADHYQSEIDSKKRKCDADAKRTEESIKKLTTRVEELSWLDKASVIISDIEYKEKVIEGKEATIKAIKTSMADYAEMSRKMDSYRDIPEKAAELIKKIEAFNIDKKASEKLSLYDSIQHYKKYQKDTEAGSILEEAERKIRKIQKLTEMVDSGRKAVDSLGASMTHYKKLKEDWLANEKELDVAEAVMKLSCICPHSNLPCDKIKSEVAF
jgi:exonuclease SbcC